MNDPYSMFDPTAQQMDYGTGPQQYFQSQDGQQIYMDQMAYGGGQQQLQPPYMDMSYPQAPQYNDPAIMMMK